MELIRRQSRTHTRLRNEFMEAQDGHCAICLQLITDKANLDHCHLTGFVRGVLCTSCNTKLGWYEARRHHLERYLASAAEFQAYSPQFITPATTTWERDVRPTRARTVSDDAEESALVTAV